MKSAFLIQTSVLLTIATLIVACDTKKSRGIDTKLATPSLTCTGGDCTSPDLTTPKLTTPKVSGQDGTANTGATTASDSATAASGQKTKTENGQACSAEISDLLSSIAAQMPNALKEKSADAKALAQKACEAFQQQIGDNTCEVKDNATREAKTISKLAFSDDCAAVGVKLKTEASVPATLGSDAKKKAAAEVTQPAPQVDSKIDQTKNITEYKKIAFTIRDAEALRKVAVNTGSLQEGAYMDESQKALDASKGSCYLADVSITFHVDNGAVYNMTKISADKEKLTLVSDDGYLNVVCAKPSSIEKPSSDWSLTELKMILGITIDMTVLE